MSEDKEKKKKGGAGTLLIALMALIGSAAGSATVQILLPHPPAGAAAEGEHATAEAHAEGEGANDLPPGAVVGYFLELPEVVVNLGGEDLGHYLRAKIVLELVRDPGEQIDAAMPLLRDIMLTTLSGMTLEEIAADPDRSKLKQEIAESLGGVIGGIRRVLINDFVVQ
ncbi:MAG: hypothetical protein D6761_03610 [Candidatus Dadabacteria bacterium]|nr:MAG: hypothetical protein D6761_03610 [Candidatus Dadabacteria bacterium]